MKTWLLAALALIAAVVPAAAAPPKSVLILAEGPILPYGAVLREQLITLLRRDSPDPLNIYEELIDRVRFDNAPYERQLVALYKSKYVDAAAPAVVITITEPALDFALRHRAELFPRAALLFGAVDERVVRGRDLGPNVTGVYSHYDARATVAAALAVHPGTRRVVVVGGTSRLDRGYVEVAREDLRPLESQVEISYITGTSLKAATAAVAALRDDAVVVFLSMQTDGDGVARTGPEVLAELRRASAVPIYGMSGNFIGRGIVGGVVFDMQSHGADLARRAVQILSGVGAADLVPMRSPNSLTFDARELKRFSVDEARLPTGAQVVNRELSLWDLYKASILTVVAVLVGQFLLIGNLLIQRHRLRRAERALRDLSARLISAQEEERRRIARELHDNVSQQIALLAIRIDQVAGDPAQTPGSVAGSMRELRQRAVDIAGEIRSLSHQLHSAKLEMLGLVEAVRGQCQEMATLGIRASFHEDRVPATLPNDVALCVFRIVQEALNNVAKHSGAFEAEVSLRASGDMLEATIADGGRGFDTAAAGSGKGLGLSSMRERLRPFSGELIVRSQANRGTIIVVRVPISGRATASSESARVA